MDENNAYYKQISHDPTKNVKENTQKIATDSNLEKLRIEFIKESSKYFYTYNFTWLGRPIIQYPQDMVAVQEIIWNTKPNMVIETGVAHGGSLIFYGSILKAMGVDFKVIGIDISIRPVNRKEIENHILSENIKLLEGSSIDDKIISQVKQLINPKDRVMVILDSNHSHQHVLNELKLYSPLVSKNCYLIVFDTIVEDMDSDFVQDRPWGKGNNPKTAVKEFLSKNKDFEIDTDIFNKLIISNAPDGYLIRK